VKTHRLSGLREGFSIFRLSIHFGILNAGLLKALNPSEKFSHLCILVELLRRYVFTCAVIVYVITAIGVPVYLHYCGGELETINYVMKADSCCGGEESDEEDNGCCKDEGFILKSTADCTTKDTSPKIAKNFFPVLSILFNLKPIENHSCPKSEVATTNHPVRSQDHIVSISVLRI
jgi:hypothetical protein